MAHKVRIEKDVTGDSYYSGELYGDWWETTYTSYFGLSHSTLPFDEDVDFVPVDGETYYLVDVEYSTGDSFGHADGCRQLIGVFKTQEEAERIQKMIEDDYKNSPNNYGSLEYKGRECIYTGTWKGYFESFDGCNVYPLVYTGEK